MIDNINPTDTKPEQDARCGECMAHEGEVGQPVTLMIPVTTGDQMRAVRFGLMMYERSREEEVGETHSTLVQLQHVILAAEMAGLDSGQSPPVTIKVPPHLFDWLFSAATGWSSDPEENGGKVPPREEWCGELDSKSRYTAEIAFMAVAGMASGSDTATISVPAAKMIEKFLEGELERAKRELEAIRTLKENLEAACENSEPLQELIKEEAEHLIKRDDEDRAEGIAAAQPVQAA